MTQEERDKKICAALREHMKSIVAEIIEKDPKNSVLYLKRAAEYVPKSE